MPPPLPPPLPSAPPPSARPLPRAALSGDVAVALGTSPQCTAISLPRAEVLRVRRLAKQLLFATVRPLEPLVELMEVGGAQTVRVPPSVASVAGSAAAVDSAAAASGPKELEWQIILGKTLVAAAGERRADELMRSVRPGAVIAATGVPKINPRELADVVVRRAQPTQIDLVLDEIAILQPRDATPTESTTEGTTEGMTEGTTEGMTEETTKGVAVPPNGSGTVASSSGGAVGMAPAADLEELLTPELAGTRPATPLGGVPARGVDGVDESEPQQLDGALLAAMPAPSLIDDEAGLLRLGEALDALPDGALVGLDVEWLPASLRHERIEEGDDGEEGDGVGAALLQIAARESTWVVDLQSLH